MNLAHNSKERCSQIFNAGALPLLITLQKEWAEVGKETAGTIFQKLTAKTKRLVSLLTEASTVAAARASKDAASAEAAAAELLAEQETDKV